MTLKKKKTTFRMNLRGVLEVPATLFGLFWPLFNGGSDPLYKKGYNF